MRNLSSAALAVLLLALSAREAGAVQLVTACQTDCTQNCALANDLSCSGAGVRLLNGADLDFKGYKLQCTTPGGCSASGVQMISGTNSVVRDTGGTAGTKGGIYGGWNVAVDCGARSGSTVTGIVIDGAKVVAIQNCGEVDHNVVNGGDDALPYDSFAIERHAGVSTGSDVVVDNYVSWFGRGIRVTNAKPITIEHNTIVQGSGASPNVAIDTQLVAAASVVVRYNTILTSDDVIQPIAANAANAVSVNFCDPARAPCQACIGSGRCAALQHTISSVPTLRLRIVSNGDVNQADFHAPYTPIIPLVHRWLLVTDFPEQPLTYTYATGNSWVSYIGLGIGIGTDLFRVGGVKDPEQPGEPLSICWLRSHMVSESYNGVGTTPTWLVVKQNGVQNNGSLITVGPMIGEYARTMPVNPVTGQPWNTADFDANGFQIGVRNDVGSGLGVTFLDLLMECAY